MSEQGDDAPQPLEEQFDTLITDESLQLLLESGKNLLGGLFNDYPTALPDFVFPQISAQVLPYFLGPVVRQEATRRNVRIPTNYYFQPPPRPEADLSPRGIERITSLEKSLRNAFPETTIIVRPPYQILEEARQHRELASERAQEVMAHQKRHTGENDVNLVIIDDFASEDGNTIKALRTAFESKLPAYVFAATPGNNTQEDYEASLAPLRVGKYIIRSNYPTEDAYVAAQNMYFSFLEHPYALGYEKDHSGKYAKRSPSLYQAWGDNLRKELRGIGEALAEEF